MLLAYLKNKEKIKTVIQWNILIEIMKRTILHAINITIKKL